MSSTINETDGRTGSDAAPVKRRRWQVPPLDHDDRLIGGVSAALAAELGVAPLAVRASFVALTMAGGWGLVFYGLVWAVLATAPSTPFYQPVPKALTPTHRYLGLVMVVLGLFLALRTFGFGFVDEIVFPIGFVLTGFLIAWSRQREEGGVPATLRITAGVVVAAGGMIAVAAMNVDSWEAIRVLIVALAIILGLGLVVGPSLLRIGTELDEERQQRVRADERARMAAHLHDSVLQTLMLIQRHADDPKRTAQIARQQERDLRGWLYDEHKAEQPGTTRLGPAIQAMASRIERDHDIRVEVITVGDTVDLDPLAIEPLVLAIGEALTNASKHAGIDRVDVFAERHSGGIDVFVRDSGDGFDPSDVAEDRLGIQRSIVDRLRRSGGRARIESEPGAGTEVELFLPLDRNHATTTSPGDNGQHQGEPS